MPGAVNLVATGVAGDSGIDVPQPGSKRDAGDPPGRRGRARSARSKRARSTSAWSLVVALALGASGGLVPASRPAATTQATQAVTLSASAGSLGSEVAALEAAIVAGSAQLHRSAVQVAQAQGRVLSVDRSIASLDVLVAHDASSVTSHRAEIARAAIDNYVQEGSTGSLSLVLGSSGEDVLLRREYLSVATGSLSEAIANLQASLIRLHSDKARLDQEVISGKAALAQAEADHARLMQQAGSLDSELSAAQQALAAFQAAQRAAQAAAAQRAAQAAAAQQAAQAAAAQQAAQAGALQSAAGSQSTQGLPTAAGVASTLSGPAGTSSWGGMPAPPSQAAFAALRNCESGGNYGDNTGNGYYGAYQFALSTWQSLGYSGLPSQAPPAVQNQAASRLQAEAGWGQWPACSQMLGLD